MAGIEELLVSIVSKFDDAGFKKLDASTTKASKATNFLSNNLRNLFVGIIGTIGVREIVNATVKMDSLRTSMNALAGSEIGGFEQIEFLRKETNRLGQDFLTTADAYKNLFSSGKGAGMADSDIQSIFSGVLEAGTVLGSSQQQMQGALTALEQMISKGKVSTQELRLQLGNALPGAMQIAARAMGVTNQEFQKMLESGLDSQKFVMAFANQLHTEFGGKAVDASHTLRAELARLQNAIFFLTASILDGDAGKEFGKVIAEITKLLTSPAFKQSLKLVSQLLLIILKNIRLIVGVAVIMGFKRLIQQVALLRLEFLTATFAAGSLGKALQMDAGIASIKALTKASWALISPWLRLLAILGLVIMTLDILSGKNSIWKELGENTPTLKQAWNSKNGQELQRKISVGVNNAKQQVAGNNKILQNALHTNTPLLDGTGTAKKYNKDGTLKPEYRNQQSNSNTTNNNRISIKIEGANEPVKTAEAVRDVLLDVFQSVGTTRGYNQEQFA